MNRREDFVDAAKGIGILLVVLGHVYGIPQAMHSLIYSFHMPLFFIIAGYLFKPDAYCKYSWKEILHKKARAYLLPYYAFAAINFVLTALWRAILLRNPLTLRETGVYLSGILYCYPDMNHMPNCTPIWFLMALFLSTMLIWVIMKHCRKWAGFLLFGIMLLSQCLSLVVSGHPPLNLFTAFSGAFYMYAGHCMNRYRLLDRKELRCSGAVGIGLFLINTCIQNSIISSALSVATALTLSIAVLVLCRELPIVQNRLTVWLGRNTMIFIGFNYFMRDLTTEIYYLIPVVKNCPLPWPVSFVMTAGGCMCLAQIKNRIVRRCRSNQSPKAPTRQTA